MPGFFDVKEGEWSVYALYASFVVLLVGGASTIYYELIYEPPHITTLKCASEQCNYVAEMEQKEFMDMTKARDAQYRDDPCSGSVTGQPMMPMMGPGGPGMMGPGGPGMTPMMLAPWGTAGWPLVCPQCNGETLYSAVKCLECENVFYRGAAGDARFLDKCPKCSFSKQEQVQQERAAEKQKTRETRSKRAKEKRERRKQDR